MGPPVGLCLLLPLSLLSPVWVQAGAGASPVLGRVPGARELLTLSLCSAVQ